MPLLPAAAELLGNSSRLSVLARYNLMGSAPEPAFDDIAALAAELCAAPVAFVSFLDDERQWFKARVGLPVCEMPLDRSMCTNTMIQPGLTVINDLSQDERTAMAYYVAGPPNLRFYAGVRIDGPAGEPLGTVCVIDLEPRPDGLTIAQAGSLAALARQVEVLLALHQAAAERERLARRALQEKVLEFEALAENVSQLAWMAEADGSIYWFNRRWFAYTGLSLEAAKGWGWLLIHASDQRQGIVADTRMRWAAGIAWEQVAELRAADGSYRPFLTRVEPIQDETGRVTRWFGTSTDISAQIEAENRLQALNASLRDQIDAALREQARVEDQLRQTHKMEAVGQLTGGLAHDFNNILASISGNLEFLDRRIAENRMQDLQRYLDTARSGVRRAAMMTHRLLAFSRRQTLNPQPTDLKARVAGIEDLVRRTIGPAIELEIVAGDSPCTAFLDPDQLDNALLNLCLNARDAMPNGGRLSIETGPYEVAATISTLQSAQHDLPAGSYVALTVTDTGVGMPADVLTRVFEPFFTTKALGEGAGLGLSMIHGFVGQSRGEIRVASAPNQGTRVSLYFPCHISMATMVDPLPVTPMTTTDKGTTSATLGRTVLLVDDEDDIRFLVSETLTDLGCVVLQAANGKDAIDIIRSDKRIDLLITDIGLPGGITGHQIADVAAELRQALRILFITGYDQSVGLRQEHRTADRRVLTKPFTLVDLVRCTQELIDHTELVIH